MYRLKEYIIDRILDTMIQKKHDFWCKLHWVTSKENLSYDKARFFAQQVV